MEIWFHRGIRQAICLNLSKVKGNFVTFYGENKGLMPRPTHFEIPAENPEAVSAFFRDVFGWSIQQWGDEPYWLCQTGRDEAGIDGAVNQRRDPSQGVVLTIEVKDIALAESRILANGGQIMMDVRPIPGVGWVLYFKDPDGNIFGAMQPDPSVSG
jgi:predicted enzyme related to lactoylglutathione lyase